MLTINILGNNESVDRIFIYLFILFYLLFLMQMHILHSIIHHQHRFYTYKEKKKAELIDCHCELLIFVLLMSDHQFLFGFVFPFFSSLEDVENS